MANAVFLTVDRNMFPPAVFTVYTAKAGARAHDFDAVIAVPENSLEPTWIDWAEQTVGVVVKEVRFAEHIGLKKTANKFLPPSTCYRHLFHLFLPSTYDRLIYLDADLRIVGDISLLFALDCAPYAFAACPDGVITAFDGEKESWLNDYFAGLAWDRSLVYANTGVLVIDPDAWLGQNLGQRVLDYLRANLEACYLADQSALNRIVRGEFQPISPVWNMLTQLWLTADLSDAISPAVLHYAGPLKPWKVRTWTYTLDDVLQYQQFFRLSPWPHFASLWHNFSWKEYRRYVSRLLEQRVLGRRDSGYPEHNIAKYRRHIRSFDFADKRQGLVAFNAQGILGAVPL